MKKTKRNILILTSIFASNIFTYIQLKKHFNKHYYKNNIKDNIFALQYLKMTKSTDVCIPKNVYQTYKKPIPSCIQESMDILKNQNKDFNFYFFDDEMCRDFIKQNFDDEVLNAYDTLIPGAYKADLWRYCIMYIKGGIYIDCKYIMHENHKLDSLLTNEIYIRDRPPIKYNNDGEFIYQAILVSRPKNNIYLKCIEKIVENVNSRNIGRCSLDVTGPRLFADKVRENMDYLIKRGKFNILNFQHTGKGNVTYNDKMFMKIHKRNEYYKHINKNNRYGNLYPNIYHKFSTD